MEKARSSIRKLMPEYGVAAFLLLLEIYEEQERYELCACIIEEIKHFESEMNAKSKYLDISLPTRFSEEVVLTCSDNSVFAKVTKEQLKNRVNYLYELIEIVMKST